MISGVLTVIFTVSNVLFVPLTRDLVSELGHKNITFFGNHIFNFMLLWTTRLFAQFGQYYVTTWISNRLIIDIQIMFYEKLMSFSQHFYSDWKLGDLIIRLFTDTEKMKAAIMESFSGIIPQTCTLFGVIGYLVYLNWKLTVFTFLVAPIFVIIIVYFSELLKRITGQIQRKLSDISHISQESINNIKLVQSCTQEQREVDRFIHENMRNFNVLMKEARVNATLKPTNAFFQGLVFALVVFFGGKLMVSGSLTGPELMSYFTGLILLIDPIENLSKIFTSVQQSLVSSERVFEVVDTEPVIKNSPNAQKRDVKGSICFENVSFEYHENSGMVLNDINLKAQNGEIIALVGLSGAGKSTFINLIPRFYDTSKGRIMIDGVDIRELDIKYLRSQIGMVHQDDALFRGTILQNIRYGCSTATESEVVEAAKKANAWEFIEKMPDGLRTKVGDRGRRLSGGQKQRISLARIILRNPKILILDEATSSLDSKSERLVQDALDQVMKGRTTFVVAHRLSTILNANKIVVLEKGEIKEVGTHEELLAKKGAYEKLYSLQLKKE